MTGYLWAVINHFLEITKLIVTTDKNPTHHKDERWVLIKEFTL